MNVVGTISIRFRKKIETAQKQNKDILKTFQIHFRNHLKTKYRQFRNNLETCQRHVSDILNTFQIHFRNSFETCQKQFGDILNTFQKQFRDIQNNLYLCYIIYTPIFTSTIHHLYVIYIIIQETTCAICPCPPLIEFPYKLFRASLIWTFQTIAHLQTRLEARRSRGCAPCTAARTSSIIITTGSTANAPLRVAVPLVQGLKKMVKCENDVKML